MKILQIFNKYVHAGGEEFAVDQIAAKLSLRHDVRNLTFDSRQWSDVRNPFGRMLLAFYMVWNPASIAQVRKCINEFKPDLILLHNLMPVGSSALYPVLIRSGVPLIHFIHNFRPFSVNGYCWTKSGLCTASLHKNFLPEIIDGSWQDSRIKTAWYALQLWTLHALGTFQKIDGWVAISEFMASTFVQCGIRPDRIETIPHSWHLDPSVPYVSRESDEPTFLFLGRISREKGIETLLEAWRIHVSDGLPGKLVIAGEGPLFDQTHSACLQLERAECLPFVRGEVKASLLRSCAALVFPSVWWEPMGLVVFEAYEYGKPVLAARSGGIVDHVFDPDTGWLHEPGDSVSLAGNLKEAVLNQNERQQRGTNGREYLKSQTSEIWLDRFDDFARRVVLRKHNLGGDNGTAPYRAKRSAASRPLRIMAYLADQNPNHGRSLGISRMTGMVLKSMSQREDVSLGATVSRSSVTAPAGSSPVVTLPWSTRKHVLRALTDNLHPLFALPKNRPDMWYFPKGFMPRAHWGVQPSVATIHDTIIQYYQDHHPKWRLDLEYSYWAGMLRNTLLHATAIMTVSQHAKRQIEEFIRRYHLPGREIHVTYEPCLYENIPQPVHPPKSGHVVHLGSLEPHKRTAWLVRLWADWTSVDPDLPTLHVIGRMPEEVADLAKACPKVIHMTYLEDKALVSQLTSARALILPSEVEGFGLPALEAYYLGAPVCFVKGTSVEEILHPATSKGGFDLDHPDTLRTALTEVLAMRPDEIHTCGLTLREQYHSSKVVEHMMTVFQMVIR